MDLKDLARKLVTLGIAGLTDPTIQAAIVKVYQLLTPQPRTPQQEGKPLEEFREAVVDALKEEKARSEQWLRANGYMLDPKTGDWIAPVQRATGSHQ